MRNPLLLVAVLALAPGCTKKPTPVTFTTAPVERGNVVARVTATGTLSARVTVQVGSQVSGRIAELKVDFNDPVKKGQLLARIDPQLFEAAREQSRANELAADANLAKAKATALDAQRQLTRTRALAEQKLVAQADLDTARSALDIAEAGVKGAEASLAQSRAQRKQAEVNLAYTSITSPIDGTVISRAVDVGQTVAASLQAPTLITLAEDLAKMQVDTNVSEADIGKLRAGMNATFTVDAYPGERFEGALRQIRNAPQTLQNVVTYDAVLDVSNPEGKLRPGMTATVTFVHQHADDVLKVPNAALRFRPPATGEEAGPKGPRPERADKPGEKTERIGVGEAGAGKPAGTRRIVHVLQEGKPTALAIQAGLTDGSFTEVRSGDVTEGMALVVDSSGGDAPKTSGGGAGGPPRMGRMF